MAGEGSEGTMPPVAEVGGNTGSVSTTADQATISNLISEVDQLHRKEKEQQPTNGNSPPREDKAPQGVKPASEQEKDKVPQPAAEQLTQRGKAAEILINSDPELKQIFASKVDEAAKADGKIDVMALQTETLREYAKKQTKEDIEEATQEAPDTKLIPEQEKIYRETLQKAFKECPEDMRNARKQATELAKMKINEQQLLRNPNTTQEQRAQASQAVAEFQEQYGHTLTSIQEKLPKDTLLHTLLQNAPDNPELQKMMKDIQKKNLLKTILEILGATVVTGAFGAVEEAKSSVSPTQ